MSNGFGAAFFGITLFAVLLAIAGLLVVTTVVVFYLRHKQVPDLIQYVAAPLTGIVVVVSGFGIVVLTDEATALAVLFAAIVVFPLVLVGARAKWSGVSWITVVAISGMAWSLPFITGVGLLFVLQTNIEISTTGMTGLAGIVTIGGALLIGEYIGSVLDTDYSSLVRA